MVSAAWIIAGAIIYHKAGRDNDWYELFIGIGAMLAGTIAGLL